MTTPDGTQPGAASQPEDTQGDGTVGLEDRTEPGGQGSPDTNQAKAEPEMAPETEHPGPATSQAPSLDDMNVGGADAQAPSHPAAESTGHPDPGTQPTQMSGWGTVPSEDRPQVDTASSTGRGGGPELPEQDSDGTSSRVPGLQGTTPAGEAVETDVDAGAARMTAHGTDATPGVSTGHGDTHGVPASGSGEGPAPGTSQEHGLVHGIRLPEASEAQAADRPE